jgi:hypothetical protein
LVNRTNTKLVLVGSYELFQLVTDHGQVARRSEILHFPRYYRDDKDDVVEFRRIVKMFQSHWPCETVPNFEAVSNELLEATLGCTGLLKALLLRCLVLQQRKKGRWDPRMLVVAAKSVAIVNKLREEIERGEQTIASADYGESFFHGLAFRDLAAKMGASA